MTDLTREGSRDSVSCMVRRLIQHNGWDSTRFEAIARRSLRACLACAAAPPEPAVTAL